MAEHTRAEINSNPMQNNSTVATSFEQAVQWFVRLQNNNVTQAERAAFEAWLSDTANAAAYRKVSQFWNAPEFLDASQKTAGLSGTSDSRAKTHIPVFVRAAVIIVALGILFEVIGVSAILPGTRANHMTAAGGQETVILEDGSSAVLNTQSAINLAYTASERKVELLKGEAYFDVRHDPARPFTINADDVTVTALGTAFAVRKFNGKTVITVAGGNVSVSLAKAAHHRVELEKGQQLAVSSRRIGNISSVDLYQSLAWLEGRIIFDNMPFEEVVAELDRYLPGRIFIASETLKSLRVTGNYKTDDPLAVLDALVRPNAKSLIQLSDYLTIIK